MTGFFIRDGADSLTHSPSRHGDEIRRQYHMDDTATVQISREAFETLCRLRAELDEVLETIDCLNAPDLIASIRRSDEDRHEGRTTRIESSADLDRLWAGE